MTQITGRTYPVKDQLKAMGARWNVRAKAWEISDDLAPAARAVVHSGKREPQGYYASMRDPRGLYSVDGRLLGRVVCGCEDYPCCGC